MTTGEKIKEMRAKYGYRQADLANLIGCSAQVVSNIERGVTDISADLAVKIAREFHVPVDDIVSSARSESVTLTPGEYALISDYRKLLPDEQEMLLELLKIVMAHQK